MVDTLNCATRANVRAALLISVSALACAISGERARAQTYTINPAPVHLQYDDNSVDLINGTFNATIANVVIGDPANGGIAFTRSLSNGSMYDNVIGFVTVSGSIVSVTVGGASETFTLSGSTYSPNQGSGSTLTSPSSGTYTYTLANGTIIKFIPLTAIVDNGNYNFIFGMPGITSVMQNITFPNKMAQYFGFSYVQAPPINFIYLNGESTSTGYTMSFSENSNLSLISGVTTNSTPANIAGPSLSIGVTNNGGTNAYNYTDSLGKVSKIVITSQSITIQPPAASSPTTTVTLDSNGHVSQVVRNGVTTVYSFSDSGSTRSVTVARAGNPARKLLVNLTLGEITSDTDPLGHVTTYAYNALSQLYTKTFPEGNIVAYTYDARGNVTQTTATPKAGSGLAGVITNSGFDASCANAVKCNQPNWTKDALGNETDFTYDSTSGLPTSVNLPAAPNGVRPQTRITYTATNGAQLVTATSLCRTTAGATLNGTAGVGPFTISGNATCLNSSDETRTTFGYDSNLRPSSQTIAAGDGLLSATTSQTYDGVGNVLTTVGALGAGQTTVNYYDANRQLVGTVTPDPDGSGARTPAAVKYAYNADGALTEAQIGTVPDQTANSFTNSFTEAYHSALTLDAYDRPVRGAVVSGGTNYAVSDLLYDSSGRASCAIRYMNLGAVPGSVATTCAAYQTTGPYGPDRVVQSTFDADNRVLSTSDGVGAVGTVTYSPNGNQLTTLDGQNNLTSYKYDGFDRLSQTNFPVATQGGNASDANNYEQLAYDSDGHVLTHLKRDATTDTYSYDNLGRMSVFSLAVVSGIAQGNVRAWAYNLVNQTLSITQSNGGGNVVYAYDALGRTMSETQPNGAVSWQYDSAGDPTQLTWTDGFYVTYTYDTIGGVTAIGENGATSGIGLLASYSYDNLGRRTSVAFGNGTSRAYAYDPISRLAGLQLTFPNASSYNELIGRVGGSGTAISYTPTSQIANITRNNDAYAWTGGYNVNRTYITNGLNQYTNSGGVALGYDLKGNLTSSGSSAYTYNKRNLLYTATGAVGNPLFDNTDRLINLTTASATILPYYAGPAVVAETNGSVVANRYVPGPGTDEPVVWYQGSDTSSRNFLQADERGSIIAVSNSAGAIVDINAYDEFGIPASTNSAYLPRYAYTGQTWYPDIGLYNYKARLYSPTLGRFMQTDPIGYGDGLNMYNYAASDPINNTDPTGLDGCVNGVITNKYGRSYYGRDGKIYQTKIAALQNGGGLSDSCEGIDDIHAIAPPPLPCTAPGADPNDCIVVVTGTRVTTTLQNYQLTVMAPQIYVLNYQGVAVFTPSHQRKVCADYNALQDGAAKTNDTLTTVGVAGGTRGGVFGTIIGGLATFGTFISSITTGAGFRPFGVTIIPKSAPPLGC